MTVHIERLLCFTTILLAIVGTAFGQSDCGYSLFGQFLGNATGIGVGLDRRFKTGSSFGYSIGLAYTDMSWDNGDGYDLGSSYWDVDSKGVSIPFEINAILGERASKFEIGLGATVYLIHRSETRRKSIDIPTEETSVSNYYSYHKKGIRPNIIGSLNIGYRLQRRNGFFMKIGLSFLAGDFDVSPIDYAIIIPNLCLGYTFPRY
ncbi:MAG: hypothetical protein NC221_01935 [Duncaniella sp.]|nr:hypothetical protein [Muribaculum sp.]MCM1254860.1 hypothetical protein [Duncaniella sp.]